jgi:transposase
VAGRFTEQEKVDAVQLYLTGGYTYQEVADLIGIDKRAFRFWTALYLKHGREALAPRDGCAVHSEAFKMEVLHYRWKTGASYFLTAVEFNLGSVATVPKWEKQLQGNEAKTSFIPGKGTENMPHKKSAKDMSPKEMEKELEFLRMENAYLKKLRALVQEREAAEKKTKSRPSKN